METQPVGVVVALARIGGKEALGRGICAHHQSNVGCAREDLSPGNAQGSRS